MNISEYIVLLDQNTDATLRLASSAPANLLNLKRNNKWSVMEILEHVYIVEKVCIMLLYRPSAKHIETTERVGREMLNRFLIEKRNRKIEAPESLHPKGNIKSIEEFEKVFILQRNELKKNLESNKIVIDNRTHKHPFLGEMTIVDWLNFIPLHVQRHLQQIEDFLNNN